MTANILHQTVAELCGKGGELLGVVHPDVTPQELLLHHTGRIKVLPLGIAKLANRPSSTRAATLKGKPANLSPERAPRAQRVTAWSGPV
jgi:serine/threonine protein kinase